MAKPVFTANDVRQARKAGQMHITLPAGAIVTPQARDDAREFGIRLSEEAASTAGNVRDAAPERFIAAAPLPAIAPPAGVSSSGERKFSPGPSSLAVSSPVGPQSSPGASFPSGIADVAGNVPGLMTLHAGKPFEEATAKSVPGTANAGKTPRAQDRNIGVYMIFLTEDDIRQRAIPKGGELPLSQAERLTPSAMEYIREQRIRVVEGSGAQGAATPASTPPGKPATPVKAETAGSAGVARSGRTDGAGGPGAGTGSGLTHLDATRLVAKTHPRIEARGKLDSLMAVAVLAQTQFDPKDRLPALLKSCLAEIKEWIFQSLAAEVSGSILPAQSMGGMSMDVLRAVSRSPRQYLNIDHLMPDAALGANLALLNWLRALAREAELAVARAALNRPDIQESLNRLSSAIYVLMLLTHLAESGAGLPKL